MRVIIEPPIAFDLTDFVSALSNEKLNIGNILTTAVYQLQIYYDNVITDKVCNPDNSTHVGLTHNFVSCY